MTSCKCDVFWDNKWFYTVSPVDKKVHKQTLVLDAKPGVQKLAFRGAGKSDGLGITIDNVKLVRDNENFVWNGGFEKPNVGRGWKKFKRIPGWTGTGIEIGNGTIYNSQWKSQVCELDGAGNYAISQSWNFDANCQIVDETIKPESETPKE